MCVCCASFTAAAEAEVPGVLHIDHPSALSLACLCHPCVFLCSCSRAGMEDAIRDKHNTEIEVCVCVVLRVESVCLLPLLLFLGGHNSDAQHTQIQE